MLDAMSDANAVALIGFLGGIALGLAARVGRFCTLGAIEDLLYCADDRRMRMWGIAIGTAVLGAHLARGTGLLAFEDAAYIAQSWNPLASILGGLLFGYGMALCGNCGYGALARLGGGDLRAFVILLVMGLSAFVVMSGPLAHLRVWLLPTELQAETPQGISLLAEARLGFDAALLGVLAGLAILAVSLGSPAMRRSPGQIFWGVVVGLAVVSGWIGTQWVATQGFDGETVRSHSFAAPVGDTIIYLMTASGSPLSFGVGSVAGVLAGAFIGSWGRGHFRWEACDDPRELRRQIFGAAVMGVGAVLAVGCSVGQGLSAFSLLAFSAPVTFAAIFAGAMLGLRQLIAGFQPAE